MKNLTIMLLMLFTARSVCGQEAITRIWLTHERADLSTITINWETPDPGPSRVEFGSAEALGRQKTRAQPATLHHVEIPFPLTGTFHYRVGTNDDQSDVHQVKTYQDSTLRIAATSNWYEYPGLDGIHEDDPHLLISAGDLVPGVFPVTEEPESSTMAFSLLIDQYPEIFARIPFLPVPGNHDRQIALGNGQPDSTPIYDIEAEAFRSFFPLPDDGRYYYVDVPGFDLRIAMVDASHLNDMGTAKQSSVPLGRGSEQFQWYREVVRGRTQRFMVTCYNEHSGVMRRQDRGQWETMLRQNSVLFSGFGSFAELVSVKGTPFVNAGLKAHPANRERNNVIFFDAVASYALLEVPREGPEMTVTLKQADGTALHQSSWGSRATVGNRRPPS